jgi:hypothetical protein
MRLGTLLAMFVLASPTDAVAQELPLQPGQRVRVTTVPSRHLVGYDGTFQQVHGDTLILESMSLLLSDVMRLDAHKGTRTSVLLGMVLGLPIGAGVGYLVGTGADEAGGLEGMAELVGAVVGGVIGLFAGGALGATSVDKWEEVPLDRLRVSVVPTYRGVGLGASFAF